MKSNAPQMKSSSEFSRLTQLALEADESTKVLLERLQESAADLLPLFENPDEPCDQLLLLLGYALEGATSYDNRDCANAAYLCRNLCKVMKALHPLVRTDEELISIK